MLYMMDVDGTLIRSFIREKPQKHGSDLEAEVYDKVEVLPHRIARIMQLCNADPHACFALVTNQGGVAFGYQTISQVEKKLAQVCYDLHFFFSSAFSVHVCYNHPDASIEYFKMKDPRRKPGCGMLDEAMQRHRLVSRNTALFVGDMETDKEAAMAAGVAYMDAEDFFHA